MADNLPYANDDTNVLGSIAFDEIVAGVAAGAKVGRSKTGWGPDGEYYDASLVTPLPVQIPATLAVAQSGSWSVGVSGTVTVSNAGTFAAQLTAAIPAGSNVIGAVGLSQYTPVSGRLPVDGSGVTQPISAANLPLPAGASTSDLQSTANTSLSAIQASLAALDNAVNGSALDVNVLSMPSITIGTSALPTGAATSAKQDEQTAHLAALASKAVDFDTSGATDTVVAFGLLLPGSGGAVIGGTSSNPIRVDPTGTTAQPASQSGAWAVTANAGTNLNTSALALETGGNLAAAATSLGLLDNIVETSRAAVNLIAGATGISAGAGGVAGNTPRVTLADDDPLVTIAAAGNVIGAAGNVFLSAMATSLNILDDWDESDRAKANIIVGQAGVAAGAGAIDAKTIRVVPASDSTTTVTGSVTVSGTATVSGTVTANIGTTGGLALDTSVNGILGLVLAQASTTSGQSGPLVQGAVTTSAPTYTTATTSPLSLTTAGALRVDGSAVTQPVSGTFWQATQPVSGTFWQATQPVSGTVTANAGTGNFSVVGAAASGATKAGNPVQIGGVFNTTQPTVTTGQAVEMQATARGAQIVATGADAFHVIVDSGGGGGAQYAEDTAHVTGDTGTLALVVRKDTAAQLAGTDGDYSGLVNDADGKLWVNAGGVTLTMQGVAAHDAAASGNPVLVGGFASATAPANVTASDAVRAWHLLNGSQCVTLTAAGALINGDATYGLDVHVMRIASGAILSGAIASGAVASGAIASGAFAGGSIGSGAFASGAVSSGAFASGAIASGAVASGAFAAGSIAAGAFVSGSILDGALVTLGAKTDAKSTATDTTSITIMQVLKQISASVQAPPSQAVTGTFFQATQPVSGTFWQATQPVSLASLPALAAGTASAGKFIPEGSASGVGTTAYRNTGVLNAGAAIKTSSGRLYQIYAKNRDTVTIWLHLYDIALSSLGTGSTPARSYEIPKGGAIVIDAPGGIPESYANAITVATSDNAANTSGSSLATGAAVTAEYI